MSQYLQFILCLFFTRAHILTLTYANTLALGELLTYWDVRLWALSVWVMHFPVALFSAWDPNWVLMSATALLWVFESTVKVKIPIDDSWPLKRSDLTAGDLLRTSLMHMNPHALTQPQKYTHTYAHRSLQMPYIYPMNTVCLKEDMKQPVINYYFFLYWRFFRSWMFKSCHGALFIDFYI